MLRTIVCKKCGEPDRRHDTSKHPDVCKACLKVELSKDYFWRNRESVLSLNRKRIKERYHSDKEFRLKLKEKHRLYQINNRERVNLSNKKWANKNREACKQAVARWAKSERYAPSRAATVHKRRLALKSSLAHFTAEEWISLVSKQKSKCFDCGKKRKLTVGHLVPISKGGSNHILNIRAQCQSCNSKQGSKIHRMAIPTLFERM